MPETRRMPEAHGDVGEETARFQAFQDRSDDLPPAWQMKAQGSTIILLAVIVIVVAILALLFGKILVG
jgi:hypothetical protein